MQEETESKTLGSVPAESSPEMAAPAEKHEASGSCSFYRCVCCWRRACSPRIPRVAPGRDYVCMPAGADDHPAWSLLVGSHALTESGLRLNRFRVARSGRILGRSNDALEILHNVRAEDNKPPEETWCVTAASATRIPDDARSLCLSCVDFEIGECRSSAPPQVLQLDLNAKPLRVSPMPRPPLDRCMPCLPISAAGHIWAPYVHRQLASGTFCLAMQRLDKDAGQWIKVGDTLTVSYERDIYEKWGGPFLQGYAVLRDDAILVSLQQAEFFFTFNCHSHSWTQVTQHIMYPYIPILGRGVYIEEDKTIYMLRDNNIIAYKLSYGDDKKLELELPTKVDSVCPFSRDEGYGFLTQLAGRLMCSVWIRTAHDCSCDNLHALVTTFLLNPKGIEILHSTCRRLDMFPGNPVPSCPLEFCFLQEYEEEYNHEELSMLLEGMLEDQTSSHVVESSEMLACCRKFFFERQVRRCVLLEEPAVQINKDLYIVCQAGSEAIIYVTSIVNGRLEACHGKHLKQRYIIMPDGEDYHVSGRLSEPPSPWHFVCNSSSIYLVSNIQDGIHVCRLNKTLSDIVDSSTRPTADPFVMVIRVGQRIIALTDTLQVFYHTAYCMWKCYRIDGPLFRNWKVKLSGYAVLSSDSFIVSDTKTSWYHLFNLRDKRWRVVMPYAAFQFRGDYLPSIVSGRLFNGRSVFVDGFIYTCAYRGLAAYELVKEGDSIYLSDPIFLKFSWRRSWASEMMCLDYAGKDTISGAIIFCVVQGQYAKIGSSRPSCHDVLITTVQVKTERTPNDKMKPVRIDHVDIGTCFVEHDQELVSTTCCFAVGS